MTDFTYLSKDNLNFEHGRHYIGASNIPTLFGLTKKYGQTPMTLWEQLTGRDEGFKGNSLTQMGHWQEDSILARYVKGYTDLDHREFWISRLWNEYEYKGLHSLTSAVREDHPYCLAHADLVDLRDKDNPILIQAKNTGFFAANRKEDKNYGYDKDDHSQNGIPLSVYLQEQWEMYCYEIHTAYVAVLIGGNDWQLYGPIEYDKSVVEKALALATRLWEHVENGTPPKPETWPDVCKLFPELQEESTTIGGQDLTDMLDMKEELLSINQKIKKLENKKEDIINATGLLIGGNTLLKSMDGTELAKVSERVSNETISLKTLKESHTDWYEQLKTEEIIKPGVSWRGITIQGTSISSTGKCKQCGNSSDNMHIEKEGRKIIYGPFCPDCWGRITFMKDKGAN
jgi:predicted phage-related endonuclease